MPASLPVRPCGQGGVEAAELLGAVCAGQLEDEGAVGAGLGGDGAGAEGGFVGQPAASLRSGRRRLGACGYRGVEEVRGMASAPSGVLQGVRVVVVV